MKLKSVFAVAAVLIATACSANASVIETVNMTFQSGAIFIGSVTFADDFSSVTGVNGVLTGYQVDNPDYGPTFSDNINAIDSTLAYSPGPGTFVAYLVDQSLVSSPPYSHFIGFTYDYSG